MPAKSKLLGFNCISCGRNYGSIQFLKQKTSEIKRKKRLSSKRNEVEGIKLPKRFTLNSVEYSLRNAVIARTEEKLLDKITNDLSELRRNGWRLLPLSQPLSEPNRIRLESYESYLKSRVEARKQRQEQFNEISTKKESAWNVTEEVKAIDSSTYELMKKLDTGIIFEDETSNDREKGETPDNNHTVIKWNPITLIQRYRQKVDPFRHLPFHTDFYAIVLAKHNYIFAELLAGNNEEVLRKSFDVIDNYRRQFWDRNYRYTWYERYWIVRYAQAFTPRRAAKMLLALDGEKGRLSPKHVKDMVKPVIKFWEDYFNYSPYFFNFLKIMHSLIEKDPVLKLVYRKIKERSEQDNENYRKEMLEEHLKILQLKSELNVTNINININDYYLGTNNDNFKAAKIRPERVRIHHSNPNYQKEMGEFKNGLRKEKPKKKISCTFSPLKLPIDVRIKLHKEGKVPIIQT